MPRVKFYFAVMALLAVSLLLAACGSQVKMTVKDATTARDMVISYLQDKDRNNAPGKNIYWQEEDITPPGLLGRTVKQFTSPDWTIRVSYPVVLPQNTVYQVTVFSATLGWHWQGSVDFDGGVTEASSFQKISKEDSRTIAEEFVRSDKTFVFDGIEDSLILKDSVAGPSPYTWVFAFEFESRHAGYGGRTGQILAQVITPHRAVITVKELEVASAIMDGKWDMTKQEMATLEIHPAPIHEIKVAIAVAESHPLQVMVYIKGGLADGCTVFHDLSTKRSGNTIDIEVTTRRPRDAVCTLVYGFFEVNTNLGGDFTPGQTYTVNVNDQSTSFTP